MSKKENMETADTYAAATDSKVNGYDAAYWEERIEWSVPYNMQNPNDNTLTIIVNGKCFNMKRGERISVPRYVVEQYDQQQRQVIAEYRTQEKLANVNLTSG